MLQITNFSGKFIFFGKLTGVKYVTNIMSGVSYNGFKREGGLTSFICKYVKLSHF